MQVSSWFFEFEFYQWTPAYTLPSHWYLGQMISTRKNMSFSNLSRKPCTSTVLVIPLTSRYNLIPGSKIHTVRHMNILKVELVTKRECEKTSTHYSRSTTPSYWWTTGHLVSCWAHGFHTIDIQRVTVLHFRHSLLLLKTICHMCPYQIIFIIETIAGAKLCSIRPRHQC